MKLKVYHINAFTQRLTGGNPACVIMLDKWLPDSTMLAIAKENAVAETAFLLSLRSIYICAGLPLKLKWICAVMPH